MEKDIAALLALPWATLLVLAAGYAGYCVANAGLREHHKTVDIAFSTIVFGFFSCFPYYALLLAGYGQAAASLSAFIAGLLLGAIWNRIGRVLLDRSLRFARISHTDGLPSAWMSMFAETDTTASQLTLKLTDGTWLHCDNLAHYRDMPNGPCTFGGNGDILMYATHIRSGTDEFERNSALLVSGWGVEVTYIPRDKIERIYLRRSNKVISSAAAEAKVLEQQLR